MFIIGDEEEKEEEEFLLVDFCYIYFFMNGM